MTFTSPSASLGSPDPKLSGSQPWHGVSKQPTTEDCTQRHKGSGESPKKQSKTGAFFGKRTCQLYYRKHDTPGSVTRDTFMNMHPYMHSFAAIYSTFHQQHSLAQKKPDECPQTEELRHSQIIYSSFPEVLFEVRIQLILYLGRDLHRVFRPSGQVFPKGLALI